MPFRGARSADHVCEQNYFGCTVAATAHHVHKVAFARVSNQQENQPTKNGWCDRQRQSIETGRKNVKMKKMSNDKMKKISK
jgi:hypothetical protein